MGRHTCLDPGATLTTFTLRFLRYFISYLSLKGPISFQKTDLLLLKGVKRQTDRQRRHVNSCVIPVKNNSLLIYLQLSVASEVNPGDCQGGNETERGIVLSINTRIVATVQY